MTLRGFRETFFRRNSRLLQAVRTMPIIMAAAIMFAGTAAAQTCRRVMLKKEQTFFQPGSPASTRFIFVTGQAGPPLVAPALRGAISTPAEGRFTAILDDPADVIEYELSYEGLVGR